MLLIPRLFRKPETTPEESVTDEADAIYTVGVAPDGRTVLKLHDGSMTTTLTMNAAGVEQLIKLLAVTIEPLEQDRTNEVS